MRNENKKTKNGNIFMYNISLNVKNSNLSKIFDIFRMFDILINKYLQDVNKEKLKIKESILNLLFL